MATSGRGLLPRRIIPAATGALPLSFLRCALRGSLRPLRRAALPAFGRLSAVAVLPRPGDLARRDVQLPLQRTNHSTERFGRSKQQRLVVAGPVTRGRGGISFP